jgi:hypothetical protein
MADARLTVVLQGFEDVQAHGVPERPIQVRRRSPIHAGIPLYSIFKI